MGFGAIGIKARRDGLSRCILQNCHSERNAIIRFRMIPTQSRNLLLFFVAKSGFLVSRIFRERKMQFRSNDSKRTMIDAHSR
jgi:hypothetical protein